MSAYIEDARVPKHKIPFTVSRFLTGRAYDFWTRKIAVNESKYMDQTKIYTEMFDYLFPTNYRSQLREKLADLVQGNKTILEYTHELEELFIMIGNISDRDKVLKYWNGVRRDIRSALWRDGLNPEVSTWDEILAQSE